MNDETEKAQKRAKEASTQNVAGYREVAEADETLDVVIGQNAMAAAQSSVASESLRGARLFYHWMMKKKPWKEKAREKWSRSSTLLCAVGVVETTSGQRLIKEQLVTWQN